MKLDDTLKRLIKALVPETVLSLRRAYINLKPMHEKLCPICGYEGFFKHFGRPPRLDASCPKCGSLERHRLFWIWYKRGALKIEEPIIHFAAESILEKIFRENFSDYRTADLSGAADLRLDIEEMDLPDSSVKTLICNHVLEHVDDVKALKDITRVLSTNGVLIVSVPIIEGWDTTYEDTNIKDPEARWAHYGQGDHVRVYGRDFRDRLKNAGFAKIEEFTAEGPDAVKFGLLRGENFFVCHKN